ncbi:MAG: CPBP family glutamic-type intramembrane protease, partial [Candidatus Margulisiibacteriota bacterium]
IRYWPYLLEGLFAVSFMAWSFRNNRFSLYVSLDYLSLLRGLFIGLTLFTIGKFLTQGFYWFLEVVHFDASHFISFIKVSLCDIWIHLWTALIEESFWRVILQTFILRGSLPGLISIAFLFAFTHKSQLISTGQWIDFLIFSFSLGIIYYLSHDYFAIVSVHFTRNMLIVYDTYCADTEQKS